MIKIKVRFFCWVALHGVVAAALTIGDSREHRLGLDHLQSQQCQGGEGGIYNPGFVESWISVLDGIIFFWKFSFCRHVFLCFANEQMTHNFPKKILIEIKMSSQGSFQTFSNQSGWWPSHLLEYQMVWREGQILT